MRDWLVVLKDGTRVKVRADYCDSGLVDCEIGFVAGDDTATVAVFAPDSVAYYFDVAHCAVLIEGPPAVVQPIWTVPQAPPMWSGPHMETPK